MGRVDSSDHDSDTVILILPILTMETSTNGTWRSEGFQRKTRAAINVS